MRPSDWPSPRRLLAGLSLMAAVAVLAHPLLAQDSSAAAVASVAYEVDWEGGDADVVARFASDATLEMVLMLVPGTDVILTSPDAGAVTRGSHLIRLTLGAGEELRYRVTGVSQRVPLFVPVAPVTGGMGSVTIRVSGQAAPRGSFPRLLADGRGDGVATMANVPSFVLVPRTLLGLTLKDLFDVFVTLIILAATVVWVRGQRRTGQTLRPREGEA